MRFLAGAATLGMAAIMTLGASRAAQASTIGFAFDAFDGSITYIGTSLDVSTAIDLDGALLLVSEVGSGDASGLRPFDTLGLSAATTPPSSEIRYGLSPGPLGANVTLSWPIGAGPGADAFTETLTTVKAIDRTTANEIAVTLTGTLSDTSGKFVDAPMALTLRATQDVDHTLPPNVMFTNVSAVNSVPEPSTWAMVALGFGALGYAALRRRKANIAASPI